MKSTILKPKRFRYILRYLIDPQFRAEERIVELVDYCLRSEIEEVMMFVTAEELSCGHPTSEELERYITLGKALKQALDKEGIDLSLNPWATTHHNMRGRGLRPGQNFRLMVGDNGVTSTVTVCPLCEEWTHYLCSSFARLAKEIQPTVLWVEDDWRLKNHDAALGWGGCFCEEHLRRFSAQVGCSVTRSQLLEKILQPGTPHPWRSVWLDLSRETLTAPLHRLSQAIRSASPDTRVGLMSSSPDAHSAEGRDWHAIQEATGCEPAFVVRPHMAPYTQAHALPCVPSVARLTIANLKGDLEIYPELENSPRCGPYSKSRAFSVWQILNSAIIGSSGITINHYDMLGNGISLDPAFGTGLVEAKPILNALSALELDDRQAEGVQVLFSPQIARHIQPGGEAKMDQLLQNSRVFGDVCAISGISYYFSSQINRKGDPVLVSSQTLRAFSDEEIAFLLSQRVWLDAASVEILLERGFGKQIGIQAASRQTLQGTAYSYEEIHETAFTSPELSQARMTAQRCSPWLLSMQAADSANILSTIKRWDHHPLWPGSVVYDNEWGGRILSLSYPLNGGGQFFMGFFNRFRQQFLHQLLFRGFSANSMATLDNPAFHAYRIPTRAGLLLGALNPTDDLEGHITWRLPPDRFRSYQWQHLQNNGSWEPIPCQITSRRDYDELTFDTPVRALHATFFIGASTGSDRAR